jgi:hypothetical protein
MVSAHPSQYAFVSGPCPAADCKMGQMIRDEGIDQRAKRREQRLESREQRVESREQKAESRE